MKKDIINTIPLFLIALIVCLTTIKAEVDNSPRKLDKKVSYTNQYLLDSVFSKLRTIEQGKGKKINIVHIGDSHIQADFMTNVIRLNLQRQFGNGGYGFTFPYSLVSTNGAKYLKYNSSAVWQSRLNVSPVSNMNIGLSGIGLRTDEKDFVIRLTANNEWKFNSIKLIYSTEKPQYQMSLNTGSATKAIEKEIVTEKQILHKIRSGENLSVIARKYSTTVSKIKAANSMRSDNIQAGKTLKIPGKTKVKQVIKKEIQENIEYVDLEYFPYSSLYTSERSLTDILICSKDAVSSHDISGVVLENGKQGLVYHSIGVNGAKLSDFNKYPLFFKQLTILKPDLVVLSLGTNESFQQLGTDQFIYCLYEMIKKIRKGNPGVPILVTTPPPSLMMRRNINHLVGEYSGSLLKLDNVAVWDLYGKMGGEKGILSEGKSVHLIAGDKIHYTQQGYDVQGQMFAEDFIEAYKQYKQRIEE